MKNNLRSRFQAFLFPAALLLALSSCSSLPRPESDIAFSSSGDLETIVVVGTNDIHGSLAPISLKTREADENQSVSYEAGGAAYLASYIEVLKKEFGNRLLWLDAGDEFQGTIESNTARGAPMVQFFNAAGVRAAAIGNHEFDFGADTLNPAADQNDVLGSLKARLAQAKYPYLSANLKEKATGKMPPFPNLAPTALFDVGRLKVGVIGLTTLEAAVTTRPDYVKSLHFEDLKTATLRETKKLRESGAQVVVLDIHEGLKCSNGKMPAFHSFRKPTDPQGDCGNNEISELLKSIPAGTLDAVVSGHSHTVVHHWVEGVPVIQGGASGRYINLIYLTYDLKSGKLLSDRTRIEGPVAICPKVFQNQGDCNGDRTAPKNGRGALVTPRFHGETITENLKIAEELKPVFAQAEEAKRQIVAMAARPIEHERSKESPLGDLIADSIRATAKADVAVMNAGGIRAPLEKGPITYGAIFRALPFDNTIVVLTMTGRELKTILGIVESGSRGFFSTSGVQMRLIAPDQEAPAVDLNTDGKIEPWEINRIIEVKFADGSEIQDSKTYTMATLDFLALGGDDFGWFMSKLPKDHVRQTGIVTREAFVNHLQEIARNSPEGAEKYAFNRAEQPIVDPAHPRLKFEKLSDKSSKKAKKSKKRRRR